MSAEPRTRSLSAGVAREIADEQIAWWQARGVSANDAWEALGRQRWHKPTWCRVRGFMVRWLLSQDGDTSFALAA